jgi:thioredoxin 1
MGNAVAVTEQNFSQEVLKSPIPVLVDFWAAWCAPCRAIAPMVEQIAIEYAGKLKVVKLDVDSNNDIAGQYSVLNIPTLILFKGGNPVERVVGVRPKPELISRIQPHLS